MYQYFDEAPEFYFSNDVFLLQALARKGVFVSEPADCALTETVLIQTSPLRMSAHLAVIEALMMLFIRELAPPSRVLSAVRRYSKTEDVPSDSEEALIFWVNQSCQAVRWVFFFFFFSFQNKMPWWLFHFFFISNVSSQVLF